MSLFYFYKKPVVSAINVAFFSLLTGMNAKADAIGGELPKQATNWSAIIMFFVFVALTLWITKWAANRTRSRADFYTAGGGITGFQNGLAIAGDYMSAASFLGISAMVMSVGYDGLIYAVGFLVGWPIVMFLVAERLRNLGRFNFADVAGFRFATVPIRIFAACGTLTVVAFYLIAQMVGAGQLIKLLFGLDYLYAVVLVGVLMMIYVLFGGMTATTWVQIIKAVLLLIGVTFMAFMILLKFNFSFENFFQAAVNVKATLFAQKNSVDPTSPEAIAAGQSIMAPGGFIKDPISAISFGMALMFGTAGLPHILMRFFTVPNAKEARKSVLWATIWNGYFYIVIFIIGFGAIALVLSDPILSAPLSSGAGAISISLSLSSVLVPLHLSSPIRYFLRPFQVVLELFLYRYLYHRFWCHCTCSLRSGTFSAPFKWCGGSKYGRGYGRKGGRRKYVLRFYFFYFCCGFCDYSGCCRRPHSFRCNSNFP